MTALSMYLGAAALLATGGFVAATHPWPEPPRLRVPLAAVLTALALWTAAGVVPARVHFGYLVVTDGELMGRVFPGVWKAHMFGAAMFLLAPVELALAAALALGRRHLALGLGLAGVALAIVLLFTRLTWPLASPAFL